MTPVRLHPDRPRRRRRWAWTAAVLAGMLLATLGILMAVFQFGLPSWMDEVDRNHMHEGTPAPSASRCTSRRSTTVWLGCRW